MTKKVFIKTFGCQMNEYDSNRIYESISKIGYKKTETVDEANCYILNTCHIRDKAKEKVYHEVGRVKKLYNNKAKPILVVAGCVAQAENQEMIKREPYIDIVIGPQSYHKINQVLQNFTAKQKEEETDFDTIQKFEYFDKIKNTNNKVSSFLTIQEGCDKFCNFCVVPFTRGPEYSRPFKKIISEAEELTKNGVKEITLIGQNVNAYSFTENARTYRISDIINELENFSELKRIRYTTSHPKDMTDDLIDCYSRSKKLMPFIHLPIQSGSNKILKLMNRKHTVQYYISVYEKLKKINPKIEFSSDFIIGYPGETNSDFEETIDLIKNVEFASSYSFKYSARPGTPASLMETLIEEDLLNKRLKKIQKLLLDQQNHFNLSFLGQEIDVLFEKKAKKENQYVGRTPYLQPVHVFSAKNIIGKSLKIKLENLTSFSFHGKILNS